MLNQVADQLAELFRCRVADGVRDIEGGGAGFDGFAQHHRQELRVRAAGVLRRELHVVTQIAGIADRPNDLLDALLPVHLELVLQMDVAGSQEGMDAMTWRLSDRFESAVDVFPVGASQAGDNHGLTSLASFCQ